MRALIPALLLALAACDRGGSPAPEPSPEPAATQPADPAITAAPPPRFTSDYSRFSLEACTVTAEATEGESIDWRCPGRGGVLLFAHLGDGRMDLDAGDPTNDFASLGAFNDIAETIEWRFDRGAPVAVIFRYRDATPEGRAAGRTVLAVEKVGSEGTAGCRMAHVAGNVPEANAKAREFADRAGEFACGKDTISYLGDAR